VDDATLARFMELHRDLPRQAPGGAEFTRRALELVGELPARPRIVDFGCGPGAHTLDLLEALPDSEVVALDLLPALLDELRDRAGARGVRDRLTVLEGDMAAPPPQVQSGGFDLVWSEGAAYSIGFDAALEAWRGLLVPGGGIAVSELTWTAPAAAIPEAARAFWAEEYPAMRADAANRAAFAARGYALTGSFALPASAWWAPYYTPLRDRLPAFEAAHAGDPAARAVAEETRREIENFERYGDTFAYVFYVGRRS
jgi:SAM-dependent methyltransferase